jgi:hypothetical protein
MDDFQDLDDLLKESVAIAAAKKAKAQGKKLSTKQSLIIEEIKKVDERALWEDQIAYAHLNTLQCKCGDTVPASKATTCTNWLVMGQGGDWSGWMKFLQASPLRVSIPLPLLRVAISA